MPSLYYSVVHIAGDTNQTTPEVIAQPGLNIYAVILQINVLGAY